MKRGEFDFLYIQIGKNIRKFRKQTKFSQETLAFELDSDRSYIGALERGEKRASVKILYKIAKALGVELADLVRIKD